MELIIGKICSVIALGLSCFVLGRNSVKMNEPKENKEEIIKIKPFQK